MRQLEETTNTSEEIKAAQSAERDRCVEAIVKSKASKKIIVAGPGTGKTFTFGKVLEITRDGNNIAMTFIRKLAADMEAALGEKAEVKTFHAYCKKVLHEQNGRVDLIPYLSAIVARDAVELDDKLRDFDAKFQTLDDKTPEVSFYLNRGDYYEVVSFNDSVYRLYKLLQKNTDVLPNFDQILIDEFQDFNPLEVAFINELEKKGPILIVGDDDQAIYDDRYASPQFLRDKFTSGEYERFELPFCGRCPEVIVEAAKSIIEVAQQLGHLKNRIPKRYEFFVPEKEPDSKKFPKIITAHCSNAVTVATYVDKAIRSIDEADIVESWRTEKEYPTVLIVGPKQYLAKIQKDLQDDYPNLKYQKPSDSMYGVVQGYAQLLVRPDSNLGWRILAEYFLTKDQFQSVLKATEQGRPMVELLPPEFVETHRRTLELVKIQALGGELSGEMLEELISIVGGFTGELISSFPMTSEDEPPVDKTKPSILLTSLKGCKGLSAGHVFIVGANNGSIPFDAKNPSEIEISQFLVALTRTRKQCHIISNKWLYTPKDKTKNWIPQMEKSIFVKFIRPELLQNLGDLNSQAVRAL